MTVSRPLGFGRCLHCNEAPRQRSPHRSAGRPYALPPPAHSRRGHRPGQAAYCRPPAPVPASLAIPSHVSRLVDSRCAFSARWRCWVASLIPELAMLAHQLSKYSGDSGTGWVTSTVCRLTPRAPTGELGRYIAVPHPSSRTSTPSRHGGNRQSCDSGTCQIPTTEPWLTSCRRLARRLKRES